ncbi:lysine decarboxylase DesA [Nocardioides lentus]|uniref:Lysine decarboxylase DesA n=1 Tax=Nocardioides lentus TaxID=338077 RepID=A0ABP5AXI1_9ACTN
MSLAPRSDHLFSPDNLDGYVEAMRASVDHLAATVRGVDGPATGASPEQVAKLVTDVDLDRPVGDLAAALDEMSRVYLDDAVWFHEPAYAAHLNPPVVLPALAAEVFVSAVNSSLDTFDQSVGGTFVERHLVDWTCARIGFGPGSDGVFTSGGSQSNLQALHLARDAALAGAADGQLPRLRVLASADAHFSVQKSARLLGLGADAVLPVPIDADRRMDVAALHRLLAGLDEVGLVAMAVVATAGTTDFGAIDPLDAVAGACAERGTWLHVDAAYGGGLLVSARHRHRLAGIERADSVTVDYHKTWFQPVSSSALLVRDRRLLVHTAWHADYLNPEADERPHQVEKSLQTTRRFDALKLWLTLRTLGPDLIGEHVDTVVGLATRSHAHVVAHPDLEAALAPHLSTLVFRFRPPGLTEDAADALVPRIRQTLYDRGQALVAATKVDGREHLKLTLLNPAATDADVQGVLDLVGAVGHELLAGEGRWSA